MSVEVGSAYVKIKPDFSGLNAEVARQVNPMAKDFGGRFGKALGPVMAQQSKHLRTFTTAAKYATAGAAGLVAYGFKNLYESGSKFEKQMDVNTAVSEANRREQKKMEAQALRLGKATFFSANQAAEAQAELVKGGLSVQKVIGGGLPASLSLAEAGELDLAVAGETLVNVMGLFGLEGKEAQRVADGFATAANRTTGDVVDFAVAFKQGGSAVKQAGRQFNDGLTILEALAESGIKNSDAGTSMKTAILQLLAPTDKQEKLAKLLNLQFVDQHGNLKKAADLSDALRESLGGYSNAQRVAYLKTLAGTDGFRTLAALYDAGPKKLEALERANLRQGTAMDIAKTKMDNTAGSVEQFKGSVETAEIQIYQGMAPALRKLAEEGANAADEVGAVFEDPRLSSGQKVEEAIDVLSDELGAMWERNEMTEHLVDVMDAAVPIVAEHAGHLGFEAVKGFGKGFLHADPLGKAVMATWLLHFVGGKAPFVGAAKMLGKQFGLTFAAEAATGMAASSLAGGVAAALPGAAATAAGARWIGAAPAGLTQQQTARQSLAAQGGIFKNVAGGAATGGLAATLGALALPAAVGGIGVYKIATHTGHEMGDKIAAGLGERFEEKYGPAVDKALAEKDLGKLGGLRKNLRLALNLAIASGADDASVEPLKKKLASIGRLFELVQVPRSAVAGQIDTLESGLAVRMQDINNLFKSNLSQINQGWVHGSEGWRKASIENMQGAISAIKAGMAKGVIETSAGTKRIDELLRNVRLAKGADPLHLAEGFSKSWRQAGQVNNRQINGAIRDLQRMPKGAREAAQDAMVQMARKMEQKGQLVKGSAARLESALVTTFGKTNRKLVQGVEGMVGSVAGLFGSLDNAVADALQDIGLNVNSVLKGLGVKSSLNFTVKAGGAAASGIGNALEGVTGIFDGKQQGGFIVPGTGYGDTFRTALPPGSFIENREAVKALPFQKGGLAPVALEPGERVYLPPEVQQFGQRHLEQRNAAVPRFQQGGLHGKPQIAGPAGPLLGIGQGAADIAFKAAQKYVDRQKSTGGFAGLGDSPAALRAAMALAQQMGLSITSTTGGGHVAGSYHYQGRAFDASNGVGTPEMAQYAVAAAKRWGHNILELFYDPLGWYIKNGQKISGSIGDHSDHVHTAMQRGGLVELVQKLAAGGSVADTFADVVRNNHAGLKPALSLFEAGIVESNLKNLSDGDADSSGALQVRASTASGMGIDPMNVGQVANSFLRRGFWGKGGAMSIAAGNQALTAGQVAQMVQGSAFPERYDEVKGQALSVMKGQGLTDLGEGGASDEHTFKEDVPAIYKGCRTGSLDFPSMPKNLKGIDREIAKREGERKRYRRAVEYAEEKENRPGVAQALQQNVTALEGRLAELRRERRKLKMEKAKQNLTKRLDKKLSKVTGYETKIEGLQRAFNIASQEAEQIVALEPQQPELPASATDAEREAADKDYVGRYSNYVNTQEKDAFSGLLGRAADWRNSILRAEKFGFGEKQPSVTKMQGGWEGKIRNVVSTIDHINDFSEAVRKRVATYKQKHPKDNEKDFPKSLRDQIAERDEKREQLPFLRFKDDELRRVLGESRGAFFPGGDKRIKPPALPLEGTGSLEDMLTEVQGIHWPDHHDLLPASALAPPRVPGRFGGAIWDVQTSIEELGLKIRSAASSLGGGSSGGEDSSDSDLKELIKELLRVENVHSAIDGRLGKTKGIFDATYPIGTPFAGVFHDGGVTPGPYRRESLALVRGEERIRTPEQEVELAGSIRDLAGGGLGGGEVTVVVNGDVVQEAGDTRPPVEVRSDGQRLPFSIRQASVTGRRTPGGRGR